MFVTESSKLRCEEIFRDGFFYDVDTLLLVAGVSDVRTVGIATIQ
jgi:hypothetical protein